MITVAFVDPDGAEVARAVATTDRLLDACDDAGAPVPFSCRGATCGSCRVEVVEGAAGLEAPAAHERETLAALVAGPTARLACAARLRAGVTMRVVVRLAPAG